MLLVTASVPEEIEKVFVTDTAEPEYPALLLSEEIVIDRVCTLIVNALVVTLAPFPSVTPIVIKESPISVGVPEIAPVDEFRDKQA